MVTHNPKFYLKELFAHCHSYEISKAMLDHEIMDNLFRLGQVLTVARYLINDLHKLDKDLVEIPIVINSGYRDFAHNNRVGGSPGSDHLYGRAVDIYCPYLEDMFNILKTYFDYNQIIRYDSFIHYSLPKHVDNRHQILDRRNYVPQTNV